MARLNIVFADSDSRYLKRIKTYFLEKSEDYAISTFTTKESLEKYLNNRTDKIDIFAFSDAFMCDAVERCGAKVTVLLSDGTYSDVEGYDTISKYQKTESIINDLVMRYAEKTGRVETISAGDKNTRIISVYSPAGGTGKTTIALLLANIWSAYGFKVFYLNYEKLCSTIEIMPKGNGTMSDVLLALKTKNAKAGVKIISCREAHPQTGVDYIMPPESGLDYSDVTAEEMVKLLEEFEQIGEYDIVVIDFDCEYDRKTLKILQHSDGIIMPFVPTKSAISKMYVLNREANFLDEFDTIADKIYPVANRVTEGNMYLVQDCDFGILGSIIAYIPEDPRMSDFSLLAQPQEDVCMNMSGITGIITREQYE